MKTFLQYLQEIFDTSAPVDASVPHPDLHFQNDQLSVYKNPEQKTEVYIKTGNSKDIPDYKKTFGLNRHFDRSSIIDFTVNDSYLKPVSGALYDPERARITTTPEESDNSTNAMRAVFGAVHDHIMKYKPDAIFYETVSPKRHALYQRFSKRYRIPFYNSVYSLETMEKARQEGRLADLDMF